MDGDRDREDTAGCLLVASGTSTRQHSTHTHSAPQRTQRRQTGSILESDLAGWLAGWLVEEDDDIRTHSHHSQHRLHSLVHSGEQTASLALTRPATFSPDTRARDTGKASLACSLSRVKHVSTNIPRHADTADDSPSASTCLAHVSLHIYIQHENMAALLP